MPLPPAPDWSQLLKPGCRIFLGSGAACPLALVHQLLEAHSSHADLELLHSLLIGPAPWTEGEHPKHLKVNAFSLDPHPGAGFHPTLDEYTPAHFSDLPALFRERNIEIEIALISVSPPDRYGYCSLGPQVELIPAALDAARVVVAQINPALPRSHGLSFVHRSQIDFAIEAETPLPIWDAPSLNKADHRIGAYVAQLIDDGDTLQLGVGRTGQAVLAHLDAHRHLGLHAETIGDAAQALFESGVIDNTRKSLLPGKIIAANGLGTRSFYDFLHENPHVDLRPTEFVNNPLTIARNHRMVAVHTALRSDLTGQLMVDSVGERYRSGMSSPSDFLRGAALSPGGRPIVALHATHQGSDGKPISNICADLPAGAGIGVSRADVHYLVTEFGIATLRGRTIQERVSELIQVAHPDHREALLAAAHARHLVPKVFQLPPPYEESQDGIQNRKVRLRDDQDYILRPLNPSDDRRLQAFFYSHTEETIVRRYGFTVTRMSRERAFELVGIDQNVDLALGLFELQGPRQVIHAIGRYYLDRGGKGAEVAFVVGESKRRAGMARCLLERILEIAAERGIETLWAQVDRDNFPMLKVFRHYQGVELPGDDLHSARIEIPVKDAPLSGLARARRSSRWNLWPNHPEKGKSGD